MKKDFIFAIPMFAVAVLLFMLRMTGMTAHIIISFVGVAVMAAYAIATKKEWKLPALEILMRALYAVALITGIVIMNVHGIAVLAVIHKLSAVLTVVALVVLLVHKAVKNKAA